MKSLLAFLEVYILDCCSFSDFFFLYPTEHYPGDTVCLTQSHEVNGKKNECMVKYI